MKTVLPLSIATLLFVATSGMGATVDYQHPKLTIVAKEEPLHSVLKSVGREMRIFVTVPSGLNVLVSCDIQQQTIKQAFNSLLLDTSYSLEWNEESGQLLGLTIFAAEGEPAAVDNADDMTHAQNPGPTTPPDDASTGGQHTAFTSADHGARYSAAAEHETRMTEQMAAQQESLQQEATRQDAEMSAYLESLGLAAPQD